MAFTLFGGGIIEGTASAIGIAESAIPFVEAGVHVTTVVLDELYSGDICSGFFPQSTVAYVAQLNPAGNFAWSAGAETLSWDAGASEVSSVAWLAPAASGGVYLFERPQPRWVVAATPASLLRATQ